MAFLNTGQRAEQATTEATGQPTRKDIRSWPQTVQKQISHGLIGCMENNRRLLEEERLLKQESVLRQIQNQVIKEKADKPEHLKMLYFSQEKMGFPCGSAGTESACNAGDLGSISGLGRSPGEGKLYPLQYSDLENPMGSQRVGHDWATFTSFQKK